MEFIRLREIRKTYSLGEVAVPVLKGISLDIRRDEWGPNGFTVPSRLTAEWFANHDLGFGRMLGVTGQPRMLGENRIEPLEAFGLKVISVGFLNPGDKPIIWRGPMLHQIIRQFLGLVEWGQLDYLVVDLPPGTGDIALSLVRPCRLRERSWFRLHRTSRCRTRARPLKCSAR